MRITQTLSGILKGARRT